MLATNQNILFLRIQRSNTRHALRSKLKASPDPEAKREN